MACIYSLEARGLENYLGFTFFIFFSFIRDNGWDQLLLRGRGCFQN